MECPYQHGRPLRFVDEVILIADAENRLGIAVVNEVEDVVPMFLVICEWIVGE